MGVYEESDEEEAMYEEWVMEYYEKEKEENKDKKEIMTMEEEENQVEHEIPDLIDTDSEGEEEDEEEKWKEDPKIQLIHKKLEKERTYEHNPTMSEANGRDVDQPKKQRESFAHKSKYKIVAMVNEKTTILNINDDHTDNLMSDRKAAELKVEKYEIENREIGTARGEIMITHAVDIILDLGICDINMTFYVINENNGL